MLQTERIKKLQWIQTQVKCQLALFMSVLQHHLLADVRTGLIVRGLGDLLACNRSRMYSSAASENHSPHFLRNTTNFAHLFLKDDSRWVEGGGAPSEGPVCPWWLPQTARCDIQPSMWSKLNHDDCWLQTLASQPGLVSQHATCLSPPAPWYKKKKSTCAEVRYFLSLLFIWCWLHYSHTDVYTLLVWIALSTQRSNPALRTVWLTHSSPVGAVMSRPSPFGPAWQREITLKPAWIFSPVPSSPFLSPKSG